MIERSGAAIPEAPRVSLDEITGVWKEASVACEKGQISQTDLTKMVRGGLVFLIERDLR